jgi:hypothetical protein
MFEILDEEQNKKDILQLQLQKKDNKKTYFCKDFKGKLSSITGIQSKFLYISKINEFSGESSSPDIILRCTENCKEKCKYIRT